MAVKEILKFGNPKLKQVSRKVDNIDKAIMDLIEDMKVTLLSTTGIGLAAPQIGELKRVILIDLRDGDTPIILINPVIVAKVGKEEDIEGCLSYPGYEGKVTRPKKVTVQGLNVKGEKVEYTAEGLLAKAFCHEIDHLDGVLYTDRARKMYKIEADA
jgi:peptide deformylase